MDVETIEPDVARTVYELALSTIDTVHEERVNAAQTSQAVQAGDPASQEAS